MIEREGGLLVYDNIIIASQKYEKNMNFSDAILYCSLLVIDGYDDWKIPNKEQFHNISKVFDGIDAPTGYEFSLKTYWTDTSYKYYINTVWIQNMSSHSQTYCHVDNNYIWVRPIRLY